MQPTPTAIFWDLENVRPPRCETLPSVLHRLTTHVHRTSPTRSLLDRVAVYYDSRKPSEARVDRDAFRNAGYTLVDCPTSTLPTSASARRKAHVVDTHILTDMVCWGMQRISSGASAHVVLVSSDGDYAYALQRLRQCGVRVTVVYEPEVVARELLAVADAAWTWRDDVLGATDGDAAANDATASDTLATPPNTPPPTPPTTSPTPPLLQTTHPRPEPTTAAAHPPTSPIQTLSTRRPPHAHVMAFLHAVREAQTMGGAPTTGGGSGEHVDARSPRLNKSRRKRKRPHQHQTPRQCRHPPEAARADGTPSWGLAAATGIAFHRALQATMPTTAERRDAWSVARTYCERVRLVERRDDGVAALRLTRWGRWVLDA